MGVPKFFRFISERYPCLTELVKEYQIPEFDNMYLDMNGIIHMCSHPDDYDPHFRISEEKIFKDIFHYIEVLFRMVRPRKVFFMAIDGVAPRAKMNQQRGRRFRTAKEAEKLEAKAKEKGEQLPQQSRFDSNCITPGTVFMARLHEQLKYFIVDKISTDPLWQQCKIILSGHETPGEGEHKVMDYIRYLRAQPGYDPNTRHCLYGLDADLIMLGLCTHDPHFSLLREEVKFGSKANSKRKNTPEEINFYLLHLSLMREYLEQEFIELKDKLSFGYDIESIIDDWVLMGFLVGNDFIPNLPNLHIANGALPLLYNAYIKVLPSFDGYINEAGTLNLGRFEKFMTALCDIDTDNFVEQYADLKYFESKTGRRPNEKERTSYKPRKLDEWQPEEGEESFVSEELEPSPKKTAPKSDLAALIKATEDFLEPSVENWEMLEEGDTLESDVDSSNTDEDLFNAEFRQHKRDYYMNKLEYANVTPEVLRAQAEGYVRAIQWNLNYYYNGVCSWSWYYPHHYAPFISDIKDFKDFKIEFDYGKPFQPYEQLLAVLPTASKTLLPTCYHKLMEGENSPIKDYYPVEFLTDLNGKKQDWEAVVLIPFIDENRLLAAMAACNNELTPEEVKRNQHGPMLIYEFTENDLGEYVAPEYFPTIQKNHALLTQVTNEDLRVPLDKLVKGAYPGVLHDVFYPGFPTMKHIKFRSHIAKAHVNVFDQPSRGENMILEVLEDSKDNIEELAKEMLGKTVFVAWPHLIEATIVSLSNEAQRFHYANSPGTYNIEVNKGSVHENWCIESGGIEEYYKTRLGIEVGNTNILAHVKVMIGRKYVFTSQGRVTLEKEWAENTSVYPWQTIVRNINAYNPEFAAFKNTEDIFTLNSSCFMLGLPHYGCEGIVQDSKDILKKGKVRVQFNTYEDPNLKHILRLERVLETGYYPVNVAASNSRISRRLFSRITGTVLVVLGPKRPGSTYELPKQNIGLNLKFNKKNEEIPGYTKKDNTWLYSNKAIALVESYRSEFPELFDFLESTSLDDMFFEDEIFPGDKGSGDTVKKITNWLKNQPFASVERQFCGSKLLEPDTVKELEKTIDEFQKALVPKQVTMQVKPHLLYKPGLLTGNIPPDPKASFRLFDRVVNIRPSYTVPLGCTGTIIAIHKSKSGKPDDILYDVLFDRPFAGGLALNCAPGRGYKMSRLSLLNKSHGVREMETKTGKPGQLLQKIGYSNNMNMQMQQQSQQSQQKAYYSNNQNSAFASWPNQVQAQAPTTSAPLSWRVVNQPPQREPIKNVVATKPTKNERKNKVAESSKCDFMPTFNAKSIGGQGEPQQTMSTQAQPEKIKILERNQELPTTSTAANANSSTGVSMTAQDLIAHVTAQMQKMNITQPAIPITNTAPIYPQVPVPYTIQLLAEYQRRSMGCPMYQYFFDPATNYHQAQLKIPMVNEVVVGQPAPNKEDASEHAAKMAMQALVGVPLYQSSGGMPMQFPPVPTQWCMPQHAPRPVMPAQQPSQAQVVPQQAVPPRHPIPPPTKDVRASVPFVPLQAVKQQRICRNSTSQASTNKKSPKDKKDGDAAKNAPRQQQQRAERAEGEENTNKPRRQRKSRIAANFAMKP